MMSLQNQWHAAGNTERFAMRSGAARAIVTVLLVLLPTLFSAKVSSTSGKTLDVETVSRELFTGSTSSPASGQLIVQTSAGPSRVLDLEEVIGIIPIESGFRGRTTRVDRFRVSFTNAGMHGTGSLKAAIWRRPWTPGRSSASPSARTPGDRWQRAARHIRQHVLGLQHPRKIRQRSA
jgi:hypothetical protein